MIFFFSKMEYWTSFGGKGHISVLMIFDLLAKACLVTNVYMDLVDKLRGIWCTINCYASLST
jgi:hypothetical protein